MKKSLLISLAAISAMSMAAQTTNKVIWDFSTHGIFKEFNDENGPNFIAKETDIIDATGADRDKNMLMDATKDTSLDDPYANQHGIPNRVVSLFDGKTYALVADATWNNGTLSNPTKFVPGEEIEPGVFTDDEIIPLGSEYAANLLNNPYICWLEKTPDNKYYGPARMHWYKSYGSATEYTEKDYGAFDAANWVDDLGAMVFIRSKQGKKPLAGTYIQFPEVQGPCKVTYYVGSTDATHQYSIIPVVNGAPVEDKAEKVSESTAFTAKKYYKKEFNYTGNDKVAIRIMTDGCGLWLQRVEIESSSESGIEDIIANPSDENAPIYNIMGIQVDENYKGIVIKNGKKYIQK